MAIHYTRNDYNKAPIFENDVSVDGVLQSGDNSVYHRQGIANLNNSKIVFPDGSEGVYREGKLVTDPLNKGTYNFGDTALTHAGLDAVPYVVWGNSYDDPSSFSERVELTAKGAKLKIKKAFESFSND